jgi:hypothetical protein
MEKESMKMALQSFPGEIEVACSTSSADLLQELVDDTLHLHPETEEFPQTGQIFPTHAAAGSGRYGAEREMHSYLLVLQAEVHLDWEQSDAKLSKYPHPWPVPVSTLTLHVHRDPPWVVGVHHHAAAAHYIAVWKKEEVGKPREEVHHIPAVVASKRDLDIGDEVAVRNQAGDHRGIQVEEARAPSGMVPGFLEVGMAVGSGRAPIHLHEEVEAFHSRIVVRQVAGTTVVVVRIPEEVGSTVPL